MQQLFLPFGSPACEQNNGHDGPAYGGTIGQPWLIQGRSSARSASTTTSGAAAHDLCCSEQKRRAKEEYKKKQAEEKVRTHCSRPLYRASSQAAAKAKKAAEDAAAGKGPKKKKVVEEPEDPAVRLPSAPVHLMARSAGLPRQPAQADGRARCSWGEDHSP